MTEVRDMFIIRPPRLNWVDPSADDKQQEASPGVGSVHDLDLADLWDQNRRVIAKRWTGTPFVDELLDVASEEFARSVSSFDEWCRKTGNEPSEKLFAHYALKGARWATLDYWTSVLKRDLRDVRVEEFEEDGFSPAEAVFTQLRVKDPDLTLLRTIAPQIPVVLNRNQRFVLALLVWEELSLTAAAKLMGYSVSGLSVTAKDAAIKILAVALNELTAYPELVVTSRKTRTPLPLAFIEYIDGHYRTAPDVWLEAVEADYMRDVSYMVEILDRAHGNGPKRGTGNHGFERTITDEQHQEIIQRRAAGESQQSIADDMGLTRMVIRRAEQRDHRERQQR